MSDYGDLCKQIREYKRGKASERAVKNAQDSAKDTEEAIKKLKQAGLGFRNFSKHHYRIESMIDFWPSTGRWKHTLNDKNGYGVESLIKELTSK